MGIKEYSATRYSVKIKGGKTGKVLLLLLSELWLTVRRSEAMTVFSLFMSLGVVTMTSLSGVSSLNLVPPFVRQGTQCLLQRLDKTWEPEGLSQLPTSTRKGKEVIQSADAR